MEPLTRKSIFEGRAFSNATPIRTGTMDRSPTLNLTRLSMEIKRQLWPILQAERPALAELLQQMTAAQRMFGGEVLVALDQLPPRALELTGKAHLVREVARG